MHKSKVQYMMSQPITITAGINSHYLLLLGHTPRIVAYYLLLPAAVQHEHGQKEVEHYLLLKHMSCENISIIDISKVKYKMQKKNTTRTLLSRTDFVFSYATIYHLQAKDRSK